MTARRAACISASVGAGSTVVVTALVDGRLETFEMTPYVAAAAIGALADVLGSSALYNAGLERAAQIVVGDDPIAAAAIRKAKVGRRL